jgi:hypothetical protein
MRGRPIYCARCREDGLKPARLGTVTGSDGSVFFEADDRQVRRAIRRLHGVDRRQASSPTMLVNPRISTLRVPDALDVWCRRHGHRRVATSDVLSARGTVYL